ncbi:hypothetical protein V8F33_011071 [Rhypophila sp. PSN 637]
MDMILAHFTRHLIKRECPKCFATRCTCSADDEGDASKYETELCIAIAQNVSALAGLNRTCKRLQHLTTRSIYQCPQTKSHQATWYLTRTLLDRPDLAEMVEFLVLGRWEAPSTFTILPPRPNQWGIPITTPCDLPPAPIWQGGGVLPDEVLSHFRNRVGLDCEPIFCCYRSIFRYEHPAGKLDCSAALRLHNSAPLDLITSLCPNLETLETDSNITVVNPGGVFWTGGTFNSNSLLTEKGSRSDERSWGSRPPRSIDEVRHRQASAARRLELEALQAGSTRTLPKLKSLKLWQTENPIHIPFEPVFFHALRISPAIENLILRGLHCENPELRHVILPTPLSLRRLRLEHVTSIKLSRPSTDLLDRFQNLQHIVVKFHGRYPNPGFRLPDPRADAEEVAAQCPPGMKSIEMDITQTRQNPQIRRNWYSVETSEALKQLGTALLAERGIEYVWRE